MQISFRQEKLACAYFFGCIGLPYGIFTSRMPALKALSGASDAGIGFLLLALGSASLCGLLASSRLLERYTAKQIAGIGGAAFMLFLTIGSFAVNYWHLLLFCILAGFASGLSEVAMNTQGILLEKRRRKLCMSFLHAFFSAGGVVGSLAGSLFAAFNLSPLVNFLAVCGLYALLWPVAFHGIIAEKSQTESGGGKKTRLPWLLIFFGFMSMACFVAEGSVAEWGSLLLNAAKGASQQQAALVFACFSASMVICRMRVDRLREILPDFYIILGGASLACGCMTFILLTADPAFCLVAYAVMGIGMAPIVPLLFSRAGKIPGISPGKASSIMSILSYTGLLFFPPLLGILAQATGLDRALWVISGVCAAIALASFSLRCK